MKRYFTYCPGKEEHGTVIMADTSFDARKIAAAASGIELTRLAAVHEQSPSMTIIRNRIAEREADKRAADRVDGFDRDDIGESFD